MMDGHAETLQTASLPQRESDFDSVDTLNRQYPYPKWRIDQ